MPTRLRQLCLLWLTSALFATNALSQTPSTPAWQGDWHGQARFLDKAAAKQYGAPGVNLSIGPDQRISGSIGKAQIPPTLPSKTGKVMQYAMPLQGETLAEGKDKLVLLVQPGEAGKLDVDFHLKSNFVYDFTMVVGNVQLSRSKPER